MNSTVESQPSFEENTSFKQDASTFNVASMDSTPLHQEMQKLLRKVRRSERKVNEYVEQANIESNNHVEELAHHMNHQEHLETVHSNLRDICKEQQMEFVFEMDKQQTEHAAELARARQQEQHKIDKLPHWIHSFDNICDAVKSYGHNNKLRWRSKAIACINQTIQEIIDGSNIVVKVDGCDSNALNDDVPTEEAPNIITETQSQCTNQDMALETAEEPLNPTPISNDKNEIAAGVSEDDSVLKEHNVQGNDNVHLEINSATEKQDENEERSVNTNKVFVDGRSLQIKKMLERVMLEINLTNANVLLKRLNKVRQLVKQKYSTEEATPVDGNGVEKGGYDEDLHDIDSIELKEGFKDYDEYAGRENKLDMDQMSAGLTNNTTPSPSVAFSESCYKSKWTQIYKERRMKGTFAERTAMFNELEDISLDHHKKSKTIREENTLIASKLWINENAKKQNAGGGLKLKSPHRVNTAPVKGTELNHINDEESAQYADNVMQSSILSSPESSVGNIPSKGNLQIYTDFDDSMTLDEVDTAIESSQLRAEPGPGPGTLDGLHLGEKVFEQDHSVLLPNDASSFNDGTISTGGNVQSRQFTLDSKQLSEMNFQVMKEQGGLLHDVKNGIKNFNAVLGHSKTDRAVVGMSIGTRTLIQLRHAATAGDFQYAWSIYRKNFDPPKDIIKHNTVNKGKSHQNIGILVADRTNRSRSLFSTQNSPAVTNKNSPSKTINRSMFSTDSDSVEREKNTPPNSVATNSDRFKESNGKDFLDFAPMKDMNATGIPNKRRHAMRTVVTNSIGSHNRGVAIKTSTTTSTIQNKKTSVVFHEKVDRKSSLNRTQNKDLYKPTQSQLENEVMTVSTYNDSEEGNESKIGSGRVLMKLNEFSRWPHIKPRVNKLPTPGLPFVSLLVFKLLMLAFKNSSELDFRNACQVMDTLALYRFDNGSGKEHSGIRPDVALYNIMMSACERDSRWRRCMSIYEDMINIHKLVPTSQTFDIIIRCCRHALDTPAMIYDTLHNRYHLPQEFCYKVATINAGNHISSQALRQVVYESTHENMKTCAQIEHAQQVERDRLDRQMKIVDGMKSKGKKSTSNASNINKSNNKTNSRVLSVDTSMSFNSSWSSNDWNSNRQMYGGVNNLNQPTYSTITHEPTAIDDNASVMSNVTGYTNEFGQSYFENNQLGVFSKGGSPSRSGSPALVNFDGGSGRNSPSFSNHHSHTTDKNQMMVLPTVSQLFEDSMSAPGSVSHSPEVPGLQIVVDSPSRERGNGDGLSFDSLYTGSRAVSPLLQNDAHNTDASLDCDKNLNSNPKSTQSRDMAINSNVALNWIQHPKADARQWRRISSQMRTQLSIASPTHYAAPGYSKSASVTSGFDTQLNKKIKRNSMKKLYADTNSFTNFNNSQLSNLSFEGSLTSHSQSHDVKKAKMQSMNSIIDVNVKKKRAADKSMKKSNGLNESSKIAEKKNTYSLKSVKNLDKISMTNNSLAPGSSNSVVSLPSCNSNTSNHLKIDTSSKKFSVTKGLIDAIELDSNTNSNINSCNSSCASSPSKNKSKNVANYLLIKEEKKLKNMKSLIDTNTFYTEKSNQVIQKNP